MAGSQSGQGRGATGTFDLAVAVLAGGSAAFAVFAMPDGLFAGIVTASRLPEILPAARPPLGDTARWSAIAAAGAATFVFVWVLLRALDRSPVRRRPAPLPGIAEAELPAEPPRVRRADAHPDAPTRRPLRAGRELGEPFEEEAPPPEDQLELVDRAPDEPFADLPVQPLPGFLVPQAPDGREEGREVTDPPAPSGEQSLEALGARLPAAAADGASIGDLMRRLESGLARREPAAAEIPPAPQDEATAAPVPAGPSHAPLDLSPATPPPEAPVPSKPSRTPLDLSPPAAPAAAEPVPPPAEDRVGHRLRSAINDLQRLSGNG